MGKTVPKSFRKTDMETVYSRAKNDSNHPTYDGKLHCFGMGVGRKNLYL